MGYPHGTKGYNIYDPTHNKIIVSRDVKFAENVFPFAAEIKQDRYEEEEDMFKVPHTMNQEHEICIMKHVKLTKNPLK